MVEWEVNGVLYLQIEFLDFFGYDLTTSQIISTMEQIHESKYISFNHIRLLCGLAVPRLLSRGL